MMKRTVSIILISLISILPELISAQEFTATVSSNSIVTGEQFQLTYSLNANGSNFRSPSFADFNVLAGPNQSTQMQIINGSVSQTLSFTYVLEAKKEGTFKIAPAEIYAGKTKVISNPLTITVTKGSAKQQSAGGGQNKGSKDAVESGGKNVYIQASINKKSVYQGEGLAVTFRMYTKVQLLNYSVNKLPSFSGFWSQDIPMSQQLEFRTESVNGETYKVADIKKMILFPQRSGTLTIDPMEGEVIARVQVKRQQNNNGRDPFFNDPFFNNPFFNNNVQDIKVSLKSNPEKITVRDLPPGAPIGFTGAVGKFTYVASLDKNEIKAHDAVNLKLKISGKGNIKLIDDPKIEFPPDFETYDPKENVSSNATSSGVTGSKTFEYLLIPRNPGNFKIPIAPFSYFDLEKNKYVVIPAPELSIAVGRGDETTTTIVTGVNKSDVQILGKDIRFIKTQEPKFESTSGPLFNSRVFYTLLLSPALLFAGLLFIRRRNESLSGNVKLVRSQRANKVAMKRLSEAKKFMLANEREKFLDEMFKALWGFISDKFQIPVSDLSKDTAALALQKRNVPDGLILQFTDTVDTCEFARFAGGMAENIEVIYKKGIDTITQLENTLG